MLNNKTMKHLFITVLLGFCMLANANQLAPTDSCSTTSEKNCHSTLISSAKEASSPVIPLNRMATSYVKKYLKENDNDLEKIKQRSDAYFKTMEAVFTHYQIPLELKYLAIVESNLNSKASSAVGAKGTWQLMAETAQTYGLKVTGKTDERTHNYKSTVAAAKYLKSLYANLGDWLLVLAAYNSGPGYIYKAIKKAGTRDFWKLQSYLPKETRDHVKRYISIHYFFEGEGGETTVTKAEWNQYQKALMAYAATQTNKENELKSLTVSAGMAPNEQKK
jgi:membrane-bound lytic murein transglycosylase D